MKNKKQIQDRNQKKKEEMQFLHSINMDKISMLRKDKQKLKKRELRLTHVG